MAELNNLRLSARGSGRRAVFYIIGTIDYDDTDLNRNGILLFLFFYGDDGGSSQNIVGKILWSVRGQSFTERDGLEAWRFSSPSPRQTQFIFRRENENRRWTRRSFNEDRPGRDEIYAWAQLRNADGSDVSEGQRSNNVSGRF